MYACASEHSDASINGFTKNKLEMQAPLLERRED